MTLPVSGSITPATPSDIARAVNCLAAAFAEDPITGFLLQTGEHYQERLTQFFSLLMRARIALGMPVLVIKSGDGIQGAAMGNITAPPPWPSEIAEEWDRFAKSIPGFDDRSALYEEIAASGKPSVPHYYLGVIGIGSTLRGRGIGRKLLDSFCELSFSDPLSDGVYLETANPSNVEFYERAGFVVTAQGKMGSANLWCMFLRHEQRTLTTA